MSDFHYYDLTRIGALDASFAIYFFIALAVCAFALAFPLGRTIHQKSPRPLKPMASFYAWPRKSPEQRQSELLARQLEAVMREHVTFSKCRVMGFGEYSLFRAALSITRQPLPNGSYPFYVFPQVSLGQIIRTHATWDWQADQAHRAINSKRCDLLIADRNGYPVAVLEYQGAGHDIGGTASRRDTIKRIAVERAGIRFVEIADGTAEVEMQRIIRDLLAPRSRNLPAIPERISTVARTD